MFGQMICLLKIILLRSLQITQKLATATKSQRTLTHLLKDICLHEDQSRFTLGGSWGICILRHNAIWS